MSLITHISGERERPETHKLTVIVPFDGGQIHAEIPAPGLLTVQDGQQDRKCDLIRRAAAALHDAISPLKESA